MSGVDCSRIGCRPVSRSPGVAMMQSADVRNSDDRAAFGRFGFLDEIWRPPRSVHVGVKEASFDVFRLEGLQRGAPAESIETEVSRRRRSLSIRRE